MIRRSVSLSKKKNDSLDEIHGSAEDCEAFIPAKMNCVGGVVPVKRSFGLFSFSLFLLAASIGILTNLAPAFNSELIHLLDVLTPTGIVSSRPDHFLFQTYHEQLQTPSASGYDRPKLVIHLGPHKTASTTLQTDLTYYQDRLAQDGYVYLGRIYHPYSNGERIVLNRSPDTLAQTYFRDMFKRCWRATKRECVEDLRDLLRSQYRKPYQSHLSLLVSDEAFLKLFDDSSESETNENYVLMKEVLAEDWDVVLVLAYRRFFEWLPSAKYQKDKPTADRSKSLWPGDGSKGLHLRPLFPSFESLNQTEISLRKWGREHFFSESTVATLRNLTSPNFQLKIYHMYGKMSVRTTFLCKVVPRAPFSCRSSQQQDSFQQETRMNARSESENMNIPSYPSALFDFLATSASSLIDTEKWERQKVARMLRDHYFEASTEFFDNYTSITPNDPESEEINSETLTPPPNPWKLPLVCPSQAQLDLLEQQSLTLEALHIPKLYQKTGVQHRSAFRSAARTAPDYCWVNTTALLASESSVWREYIVSTFG